MIAKTSNSTNTLLAILWTITAAVEIFNVIKYINIMDELHAQDDGSINNFIANTLIMVIFLITFFTILWLANKLSNKLKNK